MVQCQCKTRSGKGPQCKNGAITGTSCCHVHKGLPCCGVHNEQIPPKIKTPPKMQIVEKKPIAKKIPIAKKSPIAKKIQTNESAKDEIAKLKDEIAKLKEIKNKLALLEKIHHDTYGTFMPYIGIKLYLLEMDESDKYTAEDVKDVNLTKLFDESQIFEAESTLKAIYNYIGESKTDTEIAKLIEKYSKDGILWWLFQMVYHKKINPEHVMQKDPTFYDFIFIG